MPMNENSDESTSRRGPASSHNSYHTHESKMRRKYWMTADDMFMLQVGTLDANDFRFRSCSAFGCCTSSAFSQYPAMTLRAEFDTCIEHTTMDSIVSESDNASMNENAALIFYDIEHFSTVVRASTGKNNSPIISKFSPLSYMLVATEPRTAFEILISWINALMIESSSGTALETDVVLVAYNPSVMPNPDNVDWKLRDADV
ncbi:hypothetical protein FKW77_001493 [Venturia effusa]|uniref:Uncharacterized protein n=1 Tax=Venturia effusa TaxID=50376 RepID=A0A517LBW7_9PEZI|nr:hypothetical protein FKW77_001493 [Venturia effusa]